MRLARETILMVTFIGLALGPKSAWAQNTLWVDGIAGSDLATGSCDNPFKTIERAFQVNGNNTIWVRPGNYTAAGGVFDFGNRVIHLRSISANAPGDTTLVGRVFVHVVTPGSLLEGFTVTNPTGTCIDWSGSKAEIRGNVVTGCGTQGTGRGIVLGGHDALIIDNVISNNRALVGGGGGIFIGGGPPRTYKIVDCQILLTYEQFIQIH